MVSPVRLQNAEIILREALRDAKALCGGAIDPRVQKATQVPRSARRQRAATVGATRPRLMRSSDGPVHYSLCAGDDEPMAPSDIDQVYAFDRSVGAAGTKAATSRSPRHSGLARASGTTGSGAATPNSPNHGGPARSAIDAGRPAGMELFSSHSSTSLSTERLTKPSSRKEMPPSTNVSEAKRTSKDAIVNAPPEGVSLRRTLACVPSPTRSLGGRPPTCSGGTISRSSSAGILLPPPRPVVRSTFANAEAGNGSREVGTTQQCAGTVYSKNKAGSWCAGPPSDRDQGAPRQPPPRETTELSTNNAWRGSASAPPPPSVSPRSPRPTCHLSVVDRGPCRSPPAASK